MSLDISILALAHIQRGGETQRTYFRVQFGNRRNHGLEANKSRRTDLLPMILNCSWPISSASFASLASPRFLLTPVQAAPRLEFFCSGMLLDISILALAHIQRGDGEAEA